jgi:hypothetical protein
VFSLPYAQAADAAKAALVDHHQHLLSQPYVALHSSPASPLQPISARDVIANLDAAGIRRAVVLSAAYSFGSPVRPQEDEYAKVRAENDWTAAADRGRIRAHRGQRGAVHALIVALRRAGMRVELRCNPQQKAREREFAGFLFIHSWHALRRAPPPGTARPTLAAGALPGAWRPGGL